MKIPGLYNEYCASGTHLKFMRHLHNDDSLLSLTSDNKLMNLCDIGSFHIVLGVSKATRDNYHRIW